MQNVAKFERIEKEKSTKKRHVHYTVMRNTNKRLTNIQECMFKKVPQTLHFTQVSYKHQEKPGTLVWTATFV